jgi:DeoR/GlpR family transcriptional regulator of sugar metabolism
MRDVPATYGELTLSEIQRFNVDMAFVSPVAVEATQGAFSFDLHEAEIARAMTKQAVETILLVDHTKLNQKSRVNICPIDSVTTIITDKFVTADATAPFQASNVRMLS